MALISRYIAGLALAGLVLTGCSGFGGFGRSPARAPAPASVRVMAESFTVAGPHGFCIDESATRDTPEGAFVMLASCAALSGNRYDPHPHRSALLTASILPAATPLDEAALDRMAAFFSTEEGRATLPRPGSAGDVQVLDLNRDSGVLLIRAQEETPPAEMAADYWRGVFPAAEKLVTITVAGIGENPLSPKDGLALLRDFLAELHKVNSLDKPDPTAEAGGGLLSIFNRLRN